MYFNHKLYSTLLVFNETNQQNTLINFDMEGKQYSANKKYVRCWMFYPFIYFTNQL